MIDDTVFLVSDTDFYLPPPKIVPGPVENGQPPEVPQDPAPDVEAALWLPDWIGPSGEEYFYETAEEYWTRVGDQVLELALPNYTSHGPDGQELDSSLLSRPEEVYKPLGDDHNRLVSIAAINVSADDPTIVSSTSAPIGWTSEIYVSPENMYLVSPQFSPTVDGGTVSSIYQFSLDTEGEGIHLAATGEVPGRVLNQFSMDEYDGHLRIVTQRGWGQTARSDLFVLQQDGDLLDVIGTVEELAPGERLFSVRFVDQLAFVVTFGPIGGRWFDPLFTIDLSDPADPQVRGELEIPGFSNYLQVVDGEHLIGLGRNADEISGRSLEPQISLYDVDNLDDPQLTDRLSFAQQGTAWSEAFTDHHAIGYFPEYAVLAIPLNTYGPVGDPADGEGSRFQHQSALWVFQIDVQADTDNIELLGQIEHESHVRRSLRIGEVLFSVSYDTVKAHDILDPDVQLGEVYFKLNNDPTAEDDHFVVHTDHSEQILHVLRNDTTFPDFGERLTITDVGPTTGGGTVTIDSEGRHVIYEPAANGALEDSFTYTISDGNGGIDEATVTIELVWPDDVLRMVRLAKQDLAALLGVPIKAIGVMSVDEVDWPDGCLGIHDDGTACTTVLVPGFQIVLQHKDTSFVYHTDMHETVLLAETNILEDLVQVRVEAVDGTGEVITSVEAGDEFFLNVYVQDLRDRPEGVFAAYVDVMFFGRVVSVEGDISFGDQYQNGTSGSVDLPGLVDELGAFSGLDAVGDGEHLLASIPFSAYRPGLASFALTPADGLGHEALLFGQDEEVPPYRVAYEGTRVEVVRGWRNAVEPSDVNGDGGTTSLDVLTLIQDLNHRGARHLERLQDASTEVADALHYLDVNGDGNLTPLDALIVIGELNSLDFGVGATDANASGDSITPLAEFVDWAALENVLHEGPWTAPLDALDVSPDDALDSAHQFLVAIDPNALIGGIPAEWSSDENADTLQRWIEDQDQPDELSLAQITWAFNQLHGLIEDISLDQILPEVSQDIDLGQLNGSLHDRLFAAFATKILGDDALL